MEYSAASPAQIRIVRAVHFQDGPQWNHPFNRYPYNTLYFVMGGDGFVTINGKTTALEAGYVYLIPPDTTFSCWCETAIEKLQPILNLQGSNNEKLERLQGILQNSPTGLKGIEELTTVFNYLEGLSIGTEVKLDLTLARGLSYYTGAIFEVKALDVQIGSITGGGRYDDLTGIFGLKNMSGVGISFGADRIFDVMQQLNLFPEDNKATTQILFVNFGAKEERYCLPLMQQLRAAGINTEIYPEPAKMKKQMGYADKKGIRFVALVGETEMQENKIALKNMATGEQQNITLAQAVEILKK